MPSTLMLYDNIAVTGPTFRAWREDHGYTAKRAAHYLGIDVENLYRIETRNMGMSGAVRASMTRLVHDARYAHQQLAE